MAHADVEDFLFEFTLKFEDEATARGRMERIIGPTERIFCRLDVTPTPSGPDRFLRMRINEYFTEERFAAAGVTAKHLLVRIVNACYGSEGKRFARLYTLQDLVACGAGNFSQRQNIGEKCCDAIRKVFQHDDITGF